MSASPHFAFQVQLCALMCMLLWAACAGIGLQILPREPLPHPVDAPASLRQLGVAACVGLGALVMLGGIGALVRVPWWLFVVPFLAVGLALAFRHGRDLEAGRRIPRWVVAALIAMFLVALVESLVGLRFPVNACDDLRSYLPMAHRLLDTYGLDEPWSVRRAQSLGGFDLLRALPVSVFGNAGVGVVETAVASTFLAGLVVANGLRSTWGRVLSVGLVLGVPLLWVPRANTTGVLLGSPLLVAVLACTVELRAALRDGRRRAAARWAAASGLVTAALVSVRPNLGLLGALILALGAVSIAASPFSDRIRALVVGGAAAVIAVGSWSFAMWRTVGTPLYPLFAGNLNSSALQGEPVGGIAHRVARGFDLVRAGPYFWVTLGVLVVALTARAFLVDWSLIAIAAAAVAAVTAVFALETPLIPAHIFARYVAPMSEALAVFLACETMRSADARLRHSSSRRFAWAPPALAVTAAITLVAAGYSKLGLEWNLLPSGARMVKIAARNGFAGTAVETPDLRDSYGQALAGLEGRRTIAAVDRPYLIDYSRFDIPNLDAPGFMTPDGTFPFFTGPGEKVAVLRRAGFDILLVTDPTVDICLELPRRVTQARKPSPNRGIILRFVDWDQDIQSIEQRAPTAVRRFGSLLRIDLVLAQAELAH